MNSRVRFTLSGICYRASRGVAVLAVLAIVIAHTGPVKADGTLYLIDGSNLYTVDTDTVALSLIGPAYDDGLAPGEDPTFLYCADTSPYLFGLRVDGSGQIFLAVIGGDAERGLAFDESTGTLYGTDNQSFGIIEQTTGAFTPLAGPPSEAEALAADPINSLVYGLGTGSSPDLMVYDADLNSWGVVGVTTVADGGKAGLAYDPSAKVLYAADRDGPRNLYRIDPATASTTWIGTTGLASSNFGLAFVSGFLFADGFESAGFDAWTTTQP